MKTWIKITEDDVASSLEPRQAEALSSGDGRRHFAETARAVSRRIREQLGLENGAVETPAVPAELRGVAAPLVVEALQARLPQLAMTPEQIRRADWARSYLRRVERGEVEMKVCEEPTPVIEPKPGKRGRRVVVLQRR